MQPLGAHPGTHLGTRISAYVDGALDGSERELAHAHLADCEQCQAQVRRQRHLKQRMNCLAMAAPPASLVEALADRAGVQEHVERMNHRRSSLVHAAVTVGSLCASLTVVGMVAGGSVPTGPRTPIAPAVATTARTAASPSPPVARSPGRSPSWLGWGSSEVSLFTIARVLPDPRVGR